MTILEIGLLVSTIIFFIFTIILIIKLNNEDENNEEKDSLPEIDFDSLNYGTIKKTVSYKDFTKFNNIGEDILSTVTSKIRFVQSLGGRKIQVEYVDLLNMSGERNNCLTMLNQNHNMVSYSKVDWIKHNGNNDIVLSKSEYFGLLRGTRYQKKGEIVTLEKGVTTSDLLDYISNS